MTDSIIGLSRRAVACKGFRWLPGMRTGSKFARVVAVDSDTGAPCATEEGASEDDCYAVWLDGVPLFPDLSDAATIGCLLALVREAWEQDDMGASRYRERWCIEFTPQEGQHHAFYGDAEAEALVAALEAAP